jgi:hypothetical protein
MTQNDIIAELLKISSLIETHKRGHGSLTALKAYQRKLYAQLAK